MDLVNPRFWLSVAQIIAIDILLGGDNAVLIALACRKLPEHQRKKGIAWGAAMCRAPGRDGEAGQPAPRARCSQVALGGAGHGDDVVERWS